MVLISGCGFMTGGFEDDLAFNGPRNRHGRLLVVILCWIRGRGLETRVWKRNLVRPDAKIENPD